MSYAQPVRDALHEEARPLLVTRLAWTMVLSIAGVVVSALSDLLDRGTVPYDLIAVKMAGAAGEFVALAVLWALRDQVWARVTAAAVVVYAVASFTTVLIGSYTGDPVMPLFLLPIMVLGAAIVFPWGVAAQLAMAVVTGAMLLPQALGVGTNLFVSIYCAFAVSVYLAAAFERQQLARKALELLQLGQRRVLEDIAAAASLDAIFAQVLATVRAQIVDPVCAIVLLDRPSGRLRCAAALDLPDGFREALDGLDLRDPIADSVAAAIGSGQPAIVGNVAIDPPWDRARVVALRHGIQAAWSLPIHGGDQTVLGMLAMYRPRPQLPGPHELEILTTGARLLGIAIDRHAAREQLERYVSELDTARLRAEAQNVELAEARDQALASMRARSQFLANMSHEIRTPLNGIIGVAEILLDTELGPTQQKYTRILSQCGEHLLSVINDILDLSKIEAGKVEVEQVDFDLRALLEEVADVLAMRAHEKELELLTAIDERVDGFLRGDPVRLRQVLVNLVGNAIKFTEHGEVVIEATVVADSPSGCTVRLAVRDTGIGIPPDRQAAVFESFTQADGSTTRTHGGTGLGLTISRELVRLMGGRMGLESAVDIGSTFWCELAFARGAGRPARRPTATVSLIGRRVLVVDDAATNRLILRQSLQEWGCRVFEAPSGVEALAWLATCGDEPAIDVIILDMQMPGCDGAETARRIKREPRTAGIPIILLSSIGDLGAQHAIQEIGFADVITKPVHRSALLHTVRAALGGAARPEPQPPPRVIERSFGLRVLLAEDNRINQLVAQRLLAKLGCETDTVENGRAAVEAVAAGRYDVVLMDVQMPVMDGFEATAQIRAREGRDERLPIVAMTAHAMEGDSERCIAGGMDGYISKPITLAALSSALERIAPPPAAVAAAGS